MLRRRKISEADSISSDDATPAYSTRTSSLDESRLEELK